MPLDLSRYPEGNDWERFRNDLHRITLETIADYNLRYTLLVGNLDEREHRLLVETGIGVGRSVEAV